MEHIAIEVQPRAHHNTKSERKTMRRVGQIPGSLYGKGIDPEPVVIGAKDIARILTSETGTNTLVDLTLEGKKHLVRLTNLEVDPISKALQHVGLQKISARDPQKATIALELEGEPEPVRLNEALLEFSTTSIDIRALPEQLVASLTVDVSGMQVGDVIYASDLKLPNGFELLTSPEAAIVSVKMAKVSVDVDDIPAAEGAEPAEVAASPAANEAQSPETHG
jgi:ribosomal protein L25, Ctc-form